MEKEDFSFPKIGDTCVHSIGSPPLWNLLPITVSSNPYQVPREEKKRCEQGCFGAKLVSKGQNGKKKTWLGDEEVQTMDLLWEVFNEDLSSTIRLNAPSSSREVVQFRSTATALSVAKTNAALFQSKNRFIVVIVKVFKKLFSHNNSQGKPRKRIL
ncbi:uncharacterized protein LOC130720206 [Lotus japonicus]|uniref:uncharacterized protein LOC130720206 n=1 Tax=Lotus japonicus TaxID=34305 RepID=UPI002584EB90|nr:uncharacterized protein LOC130720206 [Lotus japonicus]